MLSEDPRGDRLRRVARRRGARVSTPPISTTRCRARTASLTERFDRLIVVHGDLRYPQGLGELDPARRRHARTPIITASAPTCSRYPRDWTFISPTDPGRCSDTWRGRATRGRLPRRRGRARGDSTSTNAERPGRPVETAFEGALRPPRTTNSPRRDLITSSQLDASWRPSSQGRAS